MSHLLITFDSESFTEDNETAGRCIRDVQESVDSLQEDCSFPFLDKPLV